MARLELRRSLTLMDATLINVGTMLASGIFITPAAIARDLASPALHLAVWIGGGLFALLGAVVVAELGAMMPQAGGIYVYLERAYGPIWGFLYGWALFLAIQCGSIAAVAVATGTYVGYFVPLDVTGTRAVAVASILGLTWINSRGVSEGAMVQNILTLAKVGAVVGLVAMAFATEAPAHPEAQPGAPTASLLSLVGPFGLAMVAAMWCYDGWIHVSYVAGEIKEPGRNIPRAALASAILVTAIYLALNLAYLRVLGISGMAASDLVASQTAQVVLGAAGGAFVAGLVAVSTLGANNGFILAGARVTYAMARDGLFFSRAANLHPVRLVPANALAMQAVWSSVLVFSGRYDQIFTYVIFVEFLFFALAAVAVIKLRRDAPEASRPYKAWGYPWTSLAFVILSAGMLANTVWISPREAAIGVGVMLSGVPAFLFWDRKRRRSGAKIGAGETI